MANASEGKTVTNIDKSIPSIEDFYYNDLLGYDSTELPESEKILFYQEDPPGGADYLGYSANGSLLSIKVPKEAFDISIFSILSNGLSPNTIRIDLSKAEYDGYDDIREELETWKNRSEYSGYYATIGDDNLDLFNRTGMAYAASTRLLFTNLPNLPRFVSTEVDESSIIKKKYSEVSKSGEYKFCTSPYPYKIEYGNGFKEGSISASCTGYKSIKVDENAKYQDNDEISFIKSADGYTQVIPLDRSAPDENNKSVRNVLVLNKDGDSAADTARSYNARNTMIQQIEGATDIRVVIDRNSLTNQSAATTYLSSYPLDYTKSSPLGSISNYVKDIANSLFDNGWYKYVGYAPHGMDQYHRIGSVIFVKTKQKNAKTGKTEEVWYNLNKMMIAEANEMSSPSKSSSATDRYHLNKGPVQLRPDTYDYANKIFVDRFWREAEGFEKKRRETQAEIFASAGINLFPGGKENGYRTIDEVLYRWTVSLGDVTFFIPPESIRVVSQNETDRVPVIRAKGTIAKSRERSQQYIELNLYFHDERGFNGVPLTVKSPNGKQTFTYKMNGFRALLAQMKFTPFLPITNRYINEVMGIFAVYIENIRTQTVPGFPKLLRAQILLSKFNYNVYMPEIPPPTLETTVRSDSSDSMNPFSCCIDYDTMRWYYQRCIMLGDQLDAQMQLTDPAKKITVNSLEFYKKTIFSNRTALLPYHFKDSTMSVFIADEDHLKMLLQIKQDAARKAANVSDNFTPNLAQSKFIKDCNRLTDKVDINGIYANYMSRASALRSALQRIKNGSQEEVVEDGSGDKVTIKKGVLSNTLVHKQKEYSDIRDSEVNDFLDAYIYQPMVQEYRDKTRNVLDEDGNPIVTAVNISNEKPEETDSVIYLSANKYLFNTDRKTVTAEAVKYLKNKGTSLSLDPDDVFKDGKIALRIVYIQQGTVPGSNQLVANNFEDALSRIQDCYGKSNKISGDRYASLAFLDWCRTEGAAVVKANEDANMLKQSIDYEDIHSLRYNPILVDVPITQFASSVGNTYAKIGVTGIDGTAPQYMGGQDTHLTWTIMTKDEFIASSFKTLPELTAYFARVYRKVLPAYPIKIDSEFTRMMGVQEVSIDQVIVSTVKDFPGLYEITVRATSVDRTLRNKEALKLLDIEENKNPKLQKSKLVKQVTMLSYEHLDEQFAKAEVYPDLELPKISELIKLGWRYIRYRAKERNNEDFYIDPDFYFVYPEVTAGRCIVEALRCTFDPKIKQELKKESKDEGILQKIIDTAGGIMGIDSKGKPDPKTANDDAKDSVADHELAMISNLKDDPNYLFDPEKSVVFRSPMGTWDISSKVRCVFMEPYYIREYQWEQKETVQKDDEKNKKSKDKDKNGNSKDEEKKDKDGNTKTGLGKGGDKSGTEEKTDKTSNSNKGKNADEKKSDKKEKILDVKVANTKKETLDEAANTAGPMYTKVRLIDAKTKKVIEIRDNPNYDAKSGKKIYSTVSQFLVCAKDLETYLATKDDGLSNISTFTKALEEEQKKKEEEEKKKKEKSWTLKISDSDDPDKKIEAQKKKEEEEKKKEEEKNKETTKTENTYSKDIFKNYLEKSGFWTTIEKYGIFNKKEAENKSKDKDKKKDGKDNDKDNENKEKDGSKKQDNTGTSSTSTNTNKSKHDKNNKKDEKDKSEKGSSGKSDKDTEKTLKEVKDGSLKSLVPDKEGVYELLPYLMEAVADALNGDKECAKQSAQPVEFGTEEWQANPKNKYLSNNRKRFTKITDNNLAKSTQFGLFNIRKYTFNQLYAILPPEERDELQRSYEKNRDQFYVLDPYFRYKSEAVKDKYLKNCADNPSFCATAFTRIVVWYFAKLLRYHIIPSIEFDLKRNENVNMSAANDAATDYLKKVKKLQSEEKKIYKELKQYAQTNGKAYDCGKFYAAILLALTEEGFDRNTIFDMYNTRDYKTLNNLVKNVTSSKFRNRDDQAPYISRRNVLIRRYMLSLFGYNVIQNPNKVGNNDSATPAQKYLNSYNTKLSLVACSDPEKYMRDSFYDMIRNDYRGRMLRAFPTFYMVFVDEGREISLWRLQDNFYNTNAIHEIQIVKSRKIAADTCRILLSNMFQTFTTNDEDATINYKGGLGELYDSFFHPKIAAQQAQLKRSEAAKKINRAKLQAGVRIHVRLGYGANAADLPGVFNGVIANIKPGPYIEIVAQGDGVELCNPLFPPADDADLAINGSTAASWDKAIAGAAAKDILQSFLCDRGSPGAAWLHGLYRKNYFTNDISAEQLEAESKPKKDDTINRWYTGKASFLNDRNFIKPILLKAFPSNRYGLYHFGDVYYQEIFKQGEPAQNLYEITSIAGAKTALKNNVYFGDVSLDLSEEPGDEEEEKNKSEEEKEKEEKSKITDDSTLFNILHIHRTHSNLPFLSFKAYGKTLWEIMHICQSINPDYVTGVVDFQFRSSVFLGKPHYYYAYRYALAGDGKTFYEKRKPYQQWHMYTNFSDIVENKISASSEKMKTNAVGIYTVEGASSGQTEKTSTIWVDQDIYPEYQKSMVVDTHLYGKSGSKHDRISAGIDTVTLGIRDYLPSPFTYFINGTLDRIVPGLWDSAGPYQAHSRMAKSMVINALKNSVKEMYQGYMIVLGDPSIKPNDRIIIDDAYEDMNGTCEVREVIYTMNPYQGFTTTITPDCINVHDLAEETIKFNYMGKYWVHIAGASILGGLGSIAIQKLGKAAIQNGYQFLQKFNALRPILNKLFNGVLKAKQLGTKLVNKDIRAMLLMALVTAAWEVCAKSVNNTLYEYISQQQALYIFPLRKYGKAFVAGVDGQMGLVYGTAQFTNSGPLEQLSARLFGHNLDEWGITTILKDFLLDPEVVEAATRYAIHDNRENYIDKMLDETKPELTEKDMQNIAGPQLVHGFNRPQSAYALSMMPRIMAEGIQRQWSPDTATKKSAIMHALQDNYFIEDIQSWPINPHLKNLLYLEDNPKLDYYFRSSFLKTLPMVITKMGNFAGFDQNNLLNFTVRMPNGNSKVIIGVKRKETKDNKTTVVLDIPYSSLEGITILSELCDYIHENTGLLKQPEGNEFLQSIKDTTIIISSATIVGSRNPFYKSGFHLILTGTGTLGKDGVLQKYVEEYRNKIKDKQKSPSGKYECLPMFDLDKNMEKKNEVGITIAPRTPFHNNIAAVTKVEEAQQVGTPKRTDTATSMTPTKLKKEDYPDHIHFSKLDDQGRAGMAYANLTYKDIQAGSKKARESLDTVYPSGWKTWPYKEKGKDVYLFNRCHLIAHSLCGEEANKANLITGTRRFNADDKTESMNTYEKKVANYLKNNKNNTVLYKVTPYYDGNNALASYVIMEATDVTADKALFKTKIYNTQPGWELDYVESKNHVQVTVDNVKQKGKSDSKKRSNGDG